MLSSNVSELKAQLSEQLRHVKQGETILVTERGLPIARIVPISAEDRWEGDVREAMEAGLLRPGTGAVPDRFWTMPLPADPGATVRAALQAEREGGW